MPAWSAKWISHAYDPRQDLGVFAFRCRFLVDSAPEDFIIRISADNRYKLYLNGELVTFGPQRGDERHWFYEMIDIAQALEPGENELLALVWNFGWMAPMAQHTVRTGFVCECSANPDLSTPGDWEVGRLDGWGFDMMHSSVGEFYIDVGPGEVLDGRKSLLDDTEWREPHVICSAEDRGTNGGGTPWMLVPRTLSAMRYEFRETPPRVRRGASIERLQGETLLDYEELLCAYPRITLSGPYGAEVRITYAESLWNSDGSKGDRDQVEGKQMRGYQDRVILGEEPITFEPLWWRTYRYLQLQSDQEVEVLALDAIETGYPLNVESSFEADDPWVEPIWNVAVRTVERCAGETYFDCPYYEQLQYVGDTRIQALIGYYLGRDRDLQRNAVESLSWSIMENGLTQSRYPSRQTQVIPPFSLWWVLMLYDQMLYDRVNFSEIRLAQAERVLNAFGELRESERESFWNFADWVPGWRWGVPPLAMLSPIHGLTHEMAWLGYASWAEQVPVTEDIDALLEEFEHMEVTSPRGPRSPKAIMDVAPQSEHAEALYRVWQIMAGREPDPWDQPALDRAGAAKCTYYFDYYKHVAMRPEDYLAELGPWKEMIESGLTTFAENPEPTRSDCHAWSAHPILGFFQIVAGVTSSGPGWSSARIQPRPGSLRRFDARIAHPDGELRVQLDEGHLSIDTPVPTELLWKGRRQTLPPGRHGW